MNKLSLFNISFDSETETSQEPSRNTPKNHDLGRIDRNDENSTPQTPPLNKKIAMPTRRTVRYISAEDEELSMPRSPPRPAPNGLLTVTISREKKNKINGVRYYFRCFIKQDESDKTTTQHLKQKSTENKFNSANQLFIAKAKKQNSKIIPITDNDVIHLRNTTPLAVLEMDNDNSEFTLIQKKYNTESAQPSEASIASSTQDIVTNHELVSNSNTNINSNSDTILSTNSESTNQFPISTSKHNAKNHSNTPQYLMSIKFTLPKDQYDGSRKIHITFLTKTDIPSPLINLPITSVAGYEGRYMIYSIKNSIIVDEKTRSTIITIRKTGEDELEIDTHFDIPPLWLFGLGIASFLGKKPSH